VGQVFVAQIEQSLTILVGHRLREIGQVFPDIRAALDRRAGTKTWYAPALSTYR